MNYSPRSQHPNVPPFTQNARIPMPSQSANDVGQFRGLSSYLRGPARTPSPELSYADVVRTPPGMRSLLSESRSATPSLTQPLHHEHAQSYGPGHDDNMRTASRGFIPPDGGLQTPRTRAAGIPTSRTIHHMGPPCQPVSASDIAPSSSSVHHPAVPYVCPSSQSTVPPSHQLLSPAVHMLPTPRPSAPPTARVPPPIPAPSAVAAMPAPRAAAPAISAASRKSILHTEPEDFDSDRDAEVVASIRGSGDNVLNDTTNEHTGGKAKAQKSSEKGVGDKVKRRKASTKKSSSSKRTRDENVASPDPSGDEAPKSKKARGGRQVGKRNYKKADFMEMLRLVRAHMPAGQLGWEKVAAGFNVWAKANDHPPRDWQSLRKKFFALVATRKPTGEGEIPAHIAEAQTLADEIEGAHGAGSLDDSEEGSELDLSSSDSDSVIGESDDEDKGKRVAKQTSKSSSKASTRLPQASSHAASGRRSGNRADELLNVLKAHADPERQAQRQAERSERSAQILEVFALRDLRAELNTARARVDSLQQELTQARIEASNWRSRAEMFQWQLQCLSGGVGGFGPGMWMQPEPFGQHMGDEGAYGVDVGIGFME